VFAAMFLVLVVALSAVLIADRASEQSARTSPPTPDRFCSQSEKIGVDSESVIYVEGCGRIEGNAIVDMLVAVHSNTPTPSNYTDCAVSWAYRYNANLPVRSPARDCVRIGSSAEVQFSIDVSGTATEFWGHVRVRYNNVPHNSTDFRLLI
jgi:hypothetical protein